MIDRYLLRYFLAIVDHGTFSRAAAQCNVSQPTLSAGIAKLEQTLGTSLFVRSNQRVQLTDGGSRFLVHARRIESEFNLAERAMSSVTAIPSLRIGVLRSVPMELITTAITTTVAQASAPRLELIEGSDRELLGYVARGRVDVALTLVERGAHPFLEEPLFEEGYALAMSKTHPLATRDMINAEALAQDVMIVRRHCEVLSETSRYFTERGVRPHFAMKTMNDDRVLQMVAAGLGITVMPESFSRVGVARPRLAGFNLRRTIGLIYATEAENLQVDRPFFIDALSTRLKDSRLLTD
jgi:DNA-binding transcriptional LysR family regulator